jgi:hypothetical protein
LFAKAAGVVEPAAFGAFPRTTVAPAARVTVRYGGGRFRGRDGRGHGRASGHGSIARSRIAARKRASAQSGKDERDEDRDRRST